MATQLCNIMKKCGSDKGLDWHNYTLFYDLLFSDLRSEILNVFELGLGSTNPKYQSTMKPGYVPGGSHYGWKQYFHHANIWGADIDSDILVNEERIKCFYVDQTDSASIKNLWSNKELNNIKFDFILDDGLHTLEGASVFFENSIEMLSDDGIFIIEDIQQSDRIKYCEYFENIKTKYDIEFKFISIPHPSNKTDNNVITIIPRQSNKYKEKLAKGLDE